jgi:hypothetical protein
VKNRNEYTYYEPQDEVEAIVREFKKNDDLAYEVKLVGAGTKEVSDAIAYAQASSEGVVRDQRLQPRLALNTLEPSIHSLTTLLQPLQF